MRFLCIDEDNDTISYLEQVLPQAWVVERACSLTDLHDFMPKFPFDLVFLDIDFSSGQGIVLLPDLVRSQCSAPLIAVSENSTVDAAVRCMKLGASEFISKPFTRDQILNLINRIQILSQRTGLKEQKVFDTELDIIRAGSRDFSGSIKRADSDQFTSLFLSGEKGTGKYRLAREIHRTHFCKLDANKTISPRFLAYGGADRSAEQQYQDLFGTDLDIWKLGKSFPGIFERAGKGSVYIDEIAAIKSNVQLAIFHMLEDSFMSRFVGRVSFSVSCKLIIGSQHPLNYLVRNGLIIPELSALLRYHNIELKPLRERTDEIIPMAWFYLSSAKKIFPHVYPESFHPILLETITTYSWPENLRELRNSLLQAIFNCRDFQLRIIHILPTIFDPNAEPGTLEP